MSRISLRENGLNVIKEIGKMSKIKMIKLHSSYKKVISNSKR